MTADLEQAVHDYAQYLDETVPAVTTGDVAPVRVAVVDDELRRPWTRRPGVVVLTAAAAVLATTIPFVILAGNRDPGTPPAPEVAATAAPAPPATTEPGGPASITLTAAQDTQPVRVSTMIGDLEFVTFRFPSDQESVFFSDVTATAHGPVAIDDATLWWSADHKTWHSVPIGADSALVTALGDDLLVVPGGTGAARFVWEAGGWALHSRIEVFEFPGSIDHIAFGPRGAVAWSDTSVRYSTDGVSFTEAERGPDLEVFATSEENPEEAEYVEAARMDCRGTFGATESRIRSVLATDAGFVAMTSATYPGGGVCEPYLWFSVDGNTWELVASESPFGELSAVPTEHIAERDGRFVAIGSQGEEWRPEGARVWVSDDGLTWRRIEVDLLGALTLDAGELGWVLTGFPDEDTGLQMWVSTDGEAWDGPHELPSGLLAGYLVPQFAVGSDTILGIGFDEQIYVVGRLQDGE
jgi:hypothetical protein